MNKRTQKLFNEAGFHQPEMERLGIEDKFEKFAELIVQECLLALEPNLYESDIEYRVDQAFYKKCERIILKHFGMEK